MTTPLRTALYTQYKGTPREKLSIPVYFHTWTEWADVEGKEPAAIIEHLDGKVETCQLDELQFTDSPPTRLDVTVTTGDIKAGASVTGATIDFLGG